MNYTKSKEEDNTVWSLPKFIALHGNFSIIADASTNQCYGVFNNSGTCIYVHIEKKIRKTSIPFILNHLDEYEVIVVIDEYCLYRIGDIIDYSAIEKDSNPYDYLENPSYYTAQDYYRDNPDLFLGEIM